VNAVALLLLALAASAAAQPAAYRFDFGSGGTAEGHTQVLATTPFSVARGHGFEPGADLEAVERSGSDPGCLASRRPFLFSVAVPEGNYHVAVHLGGLASAAATTVRAESRRLMLEAVATAAGEVVTRTFTVNVRTPAITWPGQQGPAESARVALKERERSAMDWDDKLTLEFGGARPSVCGVEITPAPAAPTVFVAGDSTVMDQPREPYASWGQMITRFLGPDVAVANHAESGESLKSFLASRRLEKITSQMHAGDYLFIQFGHNDQKPASPATYVAARPAYEAYLRVFVAEARQHGATPVLITPVQRRQFDPRGRIRNSHGDYPQAVREVARAERVPLIDLDRASRAFYEALGPEKSARAFAKGDDATHHGDYGAYELARCVVEGIRHGGLALARSIVGAARFEPARPDPVEGFALAASAASAGPGPGARLPTPANPALPSLVLVGDSTVRNGRGDGGGGQWGWGDLLAPYFDTARINVVNRAMGGLSSRTYRSYGYWDETIALVKTGDVVLIQLGHNDAGPVNDVARARGSLPAVGEETEEIDNFVTSRHEVVHTYGFYLRGFVAEVRARGATPIVCSPVPRKRWQGGRIERNRETYAGWAAEVARVAGVPFLDLGEIIARRYEELGPERVEPLFADEHTHTTRAGAEISAAAVVAGLKGLRDTPLAAFLSEKAAAVAAWAP